MCGFVSTSFLFVAMAVANGIAQTIFDAGGIWFIEFSPQENSRWTRGELKVWLSFRGQNYRTENHLGEIRPSSEFLHSVSATNLHPAFGYLQYSLSRRALYDLEKFSHGKNPAGSLAAASDVDQSSRTEGKDVDAHPEARTAKSARNPIHTDQYEAVSEFLDQSEQWFQTWNGASALAL